MSNHVDTYQIKKPNIEQPPLVVATPQTLAELRQMLGNETLVAVDTESDSLYSYFEKVCLVQISLLTLDFVIDPFSFTDETNPLDALGPMFANAQIEKIFHAAEYDILCLKRDYHFEFANLFDTMIAARILGWKNVGLGNILQERFGVTLNKKMQRADWGQRPLTAEHIAYAREDTHYLIQLRDLQMEALEKAERLEEAREEFCRLTRLQPTPRQFDPDAYWNIAGARDLVPTEIGILRELFLFRDTQARREDRPPFKILSDSTLLRIAESHPGTTRALSHIAGISEYALRRYGAAILSATERGMASPQTTLPHPRARGDTMLDNTARNRLSKLKEWRKARAAARGVESDVIVSNDVLFAVARKNPRTLEALIAASDIGPWKAQEYGEEILILLHGKQK